MHEVTGNRAGLKPSELGALERVYRRRVSPHEVVSLELAAFLCEISRAIGRQVGVLISRPGAIEHVFVGDASRILLPEVGRLRAGQGRFRGLRLVHTHLRNEALSRDDLVDLALLRLDLVAAVGVNHEGRPADLHVAHLVPPREGQSPWVQLPSSPCQRADLDCVALIAALEEEFERVLPTGRAPPSAPCWSWRSWASCAPTGQAASTSCASCAVPPASRWPTWPCSGGPSPTRATSSAAAS